MENGQMSEGHGERRRAYDPAKHCGGLCRDGQPCTRGKGEGTDHKGYGRCKLHTGATVNGGKAASRERALGEFGALMSECRVDVAGRSHFDAIEVALDDVGTVCEALKAELFTLGIRSSWH